MSNSPKFALAKVIAGTTLKKMNSPPGSPNLHSAFGGFESKHTNSPRKFGGIKQKTEYPDDKVQEMLENYYEVPKTEWINLSIGSHIRYIGKDGKFRPGGFIRAKNLRGDNSYFVLENDRFGSRAKNAEYAHWNMSFNNVIKVYAKNANESTSSANQPQTQLQPISQSQPPSIAQNFNPGASVEIGFLQKQLDDLEKKYSLLESKYTGLQEKIADLEIFSKEVGKYLRNKG
jgi:hypothetical protein